MTKLSFKSSIINNDVLPYIENAITNLDYSIYNVGILNIPTDFDYAQYLSGLLNENNYSKEKLKIKSEKLKKIIQDYHKVEKENLNKVNEVKKIDIISRKNLI